MRSIEIYLSHLPFVIYLIGNNVGLLVDFSMIINKFLVDGLVYSSENEINFSSQYTRTHFVEFGSFLHTRIEDYSDILRSFLHFGS
jgi:hypothetical protein